MGAPGWLGSPGLAQGLCGTRVVGPRELTLLRVGERPTGERMADHAVLVVVGPRLVLQHVSHNGTPSGWGCWLGANA